MTDKHVENCRVCNYGPEEIDWGLNNVAIGQIVDCSEASVRRHKTWATVNGFDLGAQHRVINGGFPESQIGGSWVPRRHWQTPNGETLNSFQFVPDGPEERVVEVDWDRLDAALTGYDVPEFPDVTEGGSAFFDIADPQIGKAGEKGGGTPETVERVHRALDKFIERLMVNPAQEIFVIDGGDPIENCFSTPSQAGTNDLSLPDQILTYSRMIYDVLYRLAPFTAKLHYVTVTSNHGEARTAMKVNPYGSENDWGLVIQQIVADRLTFPVNLIRPPHEEDTAVLTTLDGTKVAVTHGHHSGTAQRISQWVTGQTIGRRTGHDADIWLTHHYHHFYVTSVGDDRHIIGAPSCDGGSAWYSRKSGQSSRSGVLTGRFANGSWSDLTIF